MVVTVSTPSPRGHCLSPELRHVSPQTITSLPYVKNQTIIRNTRCPTMGQIQEMHLGLRQQLQQFEMKRKETGEAIIEIQRRISVLDEAMSWRPVAAEPYQQIPAGNTEMQWVNK